MFLISVKNPEGWGGGYLCHKNGKSREVGGVQKKFPLWWGYGYFLEPHFAQFFAIAKAHRDGNH